ncbi:MAG: Hsp20/alpha crystallin family protein [Bacteroidota bacterium]
MSTLVKRNGFLPTISFFDDFLTKDFFNWSRDTDSGWIDNVGSVPRVDILETTNDFRVEMAAPGMRKNDFQVELDNDMLTIFSEVANNDLENNDNNRYTRREFGYQAFKRSFYLPNTVEADKIEASYKDGMLHLIIPKKEEARKKPVKTIAIS